MLLIKKTAITVLLAMVGSFLFILDAQTPASVYLKPVKARKHSSTDWVSMMRDRSINVHDVQKAFYKWYKKNHKEDKDKDKDKSGAGETGEEDESYELFKRWEWFNVPRANVGGNRADLYKVGSDYENFLRNSASHAPVHSIAGATASWTYAGNTTVPTNSCCGLGGDGRVNRVRLFPGNNNIMYACTSSGGLWKTINGGTTWATNTDQLGDLTTSDIAINPLKTNIMYLATGDGDGVQSIYPTPATIGVLKSYDGGNTWNATGLAYTMSTAGANDYAVSELLIDPGDTAVLLAATTFGIYRSTNSGATWTQTQTGWFHSIEFEPSHPSIVYAASSSLIFGALFYKSTNNGLTWTQITSGLPSDVAAEGFDIAVTAADSNYVYVLADSSGACDFNGLYLSTNDGVSFTKKSGDPTGPNILGRQENGLDYGVGQGWYDLTMAVSQTNADSIFVGGINIWASSNEGVSWKLNSDWEDAVAPYVHADIHHIQFIPGTSSKGYVVGCDGGVFITSNSGKNWTDISNNLGNGQQYCVGPSASTAGLWITGWQDNGTNISTTPWSQVFGGDGMDCFIDRTNNNNLYAENGEGELVASTNAGASWNGIGNGITENGPWVTHWLQDPKTSTTLYSGFSNVWKSTNSGNNWSKISTWGGSGSITALAVDSANTNCIYAAQSGTIELTTNGGTNWTSISSGLPTGSASISAIAVSAKKPSHIWVTFSGYSSGNKVFASTNSGSTWTNISTGLPNLPVNCITSESGSPNGIYVGTDQGVYYHDTILNGWVFYNTGLPLVMVADLKIYEPGKELLAATFGRGTWETPLYSSPCSSISVPVNINDVGCNGKTDGSISASPSGGTSPYTYSWTPGAETASTASGLSAATYTVTVTDTHGCTATASATITQPPVMSVHRDSVSDSKGNNGVAAVTVSGGTPPYTYSWTPGGQTTDTIKGQNAGTYCCVITDNNACTNTTCITVKSSTGIDDISNSSNINIYPNPNSGSFTITGVTQEQIIELYNSMGQKVLSAISYKPLTNIDIADKANGIYLVRILNKDGTLVTQKKILKIE